MLFFQLHKPERQGLLYHNNYAYLSRDCLRERCFLILLLSCVYAPETEGGNIRTHLENCIIWTYEEYKQLYPHKKSI